LTDTPDIQSPSKAEDAFRTIGELADELGLQQHILRYWETRFPQLRPLQRAGKRRYYRPSDVALVRRIDRLLNHEGYTIRGVQKLLDAKTPDEAPAAPAVPVDMAAAVPVAAAVADEPGAPAAPALDSPVAAAVMAELVEIRAMLSTALARDEA
jgi:DNA-binding transcriptional MerR regulator